MQPTAACSKGAVFVVQFLLPPEQTSFGMNVTALAIVPNGYALPAKHIIHTVGPVWQGGKYPKR